IDIARAVGVPNISALGALDESRRTADRAECADRGIDAARDGLAGTGEEIGITGHVFLDEKKKRRRRPASQTMIVDQSQRSAQRLAAASLWGARSSSLHPPRLSAPAATTAGASSGVMPPIAAAAGNGPSARPSTTRRAWRSIAGPACTASGLTLEGYMAPKAT